MVTTPKIACNDHGSPASCYVRDDNSHAIWHTWRWKGDFSIPVIGDRPNRTLVGIYLCVNCAEVFVGTARGRLAPVEVPSDSTGLLKPPSHQANCPRDKREYCECCDVVLNEETGHHYTDGADTCDQCQDEIAAEYRAHLDTCQGCDWYEHGN